MPSAFLEDKNGPYIEVDPQSDLDYTISCWLEGTIFTVLAWELSPPVANALYASEINQDVVSIDGVDYAAGKLATTWVKNLVAGTTYVLTLHASFTAGRKDDRSIRLICKQR